MANIEPEEGVVGTRFMATLDGVQWPGDPTLVTGAWWGRPRGMEP